MITYKSLYWTPLVGRVLIGGVFLMGGIMKLTSLEATAGYISTVNLPAPMLLAILAAALEIVGGGMLILGYRARRAALALALFAIVATVLFHMNFSDQMQVALFTKNLAMIGGLLVISYFGSGKFSFDTKHLR